MGNKGLFSLKVYTVSSKFAFILSFQTVIVTFKLFSYLLDRVCSGFGGAEKIGLAHGLRHLTRDAKSAGSLLQTTLTRCNENLRMTFGVGHHPS